MWQVFADLTQLLFDEVKIVEQPLGSRRNRLSGLQRLSAGLVRRQKRLGIFGDTRIQSRHATSQVRNDRLSNSKRPSVVLKPFSAEEVCPDRGGVSPQIAFMSFRMPGKRFCKPTQQSLVCQGADDVVGSAGASVAKVASATLSTSSARSERPSLSGMIVISPGFAQGESARMRRAMAAHWRSIWFQSINIVPPC
ncbi:hypothetical protein [Pseudotabrizicola sediminis]|uniref:hypothetical protein n=1 Tax=Pseudotabrizicola sediminis TaxID=2486418 RepID=UPI001FDA2F55|nr:hypothetical protein [Pseudotabrizicola sediminis]